MKLLSFFRLARAISGVVDESERMINGALAQAYNQQGRYGANRNSATVNRILIIANQLSLSKDAPVY